MTSSDRRRLGGFVLAVSLFPSGAQAQTVVRSFQELDGVLKPGDIIVVTEVTGEDTWGKVSGVSPSSLGLVILEKGRSELQTVTTTVRRTFTEDMVAAITWSDLSGTKGTRIYPASWDKVEALQPDSEIVVFLKTGEQRNYLFRRAGQADLVLVTASGQDETMPKSFVERITRKGYRDPVGNGIGYGALVGAVGGWGAFRLQGAMCGRDCEGSGEFPTAVFGAGIGALVGYVIDRLHKGSEDLFPVASGPSNPPALSSASARSVIADFSPLVSSKRIGMGVRLRF
jgi:hypothetical protein